ncbi:MAG: sugar ABC transporter substrate-binding protein [Chloroflexi bacterium]|nr:sugar ABC transporter substrate-binding protein [Chloroflexota bacterium]
MKKNVLLLVLIGALLFSACAPAASTQAPQEAVSAGEQESAQQPEQSKEQVTITYAIWEQMQVEAHEQIIAAFEAKHPDINVELQLVPWSEYWNKLQTSLAGGSSFDTFWMNGPNFQVYASKGVLMDLQPMIEENNIDMSVFPKSLVDLYSYQGHSYGIPKDFDTIALFYNKDLFDAAGVEYPNENWTWDDLKAAAEKLTHDDVYGFATLVGDQNGYWNFVYQNGGKMLTDDAKQTLIAEPAACDAVKYLYSFVENKTAPDGSITTSVDPSTQMFPGGKLAMLTGGSWIANFLHESDVNVGVAPLPKGKQRATIIHGLSNVVWAKTKYPEQAKQWVAFLGSKEAQNILAKTGAVIPAYEGMQQDWVNAIPDMDLQVFIDATEYAVPYPTTAVGPEWSAKIMETFGQVWAGNLPIDQACELAAEEANRALNQ